MRPAGPAREEGGVGRRGTGKSIELTFEDARVLRTLFGIQDQHLRALEQDLGVQIAARGNTIRLAGNDKAVARGEQVLVKLYGLLKERPSLEEAHIDQAVRLLARDPKTDLGDLFTNGVPILTKRRSILPRSPGQQTYLEAIRAHDLVFGIGPAGTGKTYLAMAMAVASLVRKEFDRIILTRPAVEAGEKLGFLPGSMLQKVDPYLRPLYDALHDMIAIEQARRWLDDGVIEVAPLAFMRGRTLNGSFVILDEAQNCTPEQMKMFLTRLGFDSKAVVTGDVTQIDLPPSATSGLVQAIALLKDVEGIAIRYFTEADVVRHPLVQSIIRAYDAFSTSGGRGNGGAAHGR